MTIRTRALKGLIPGAVALLAACDRPPRILVVLADGSASFAAAESLAAKATFDAALSELQPGDRVLLGAIGDQAVAEFRFAADLSMPRSGVRLDDDDARDSVRAVARAAFDSLLKSGKASRSRILDAVSAASDAMRRDTRRTEHWLVVASDMVLEDHRYDFRMARVDSTLTARIIEERRAAGALPDLSGVRVVVTNAGGVPGRPDTFFEIAHFWLAFFEAAGAAADSISYGRGAIAHFQ